MRLIAFVTLATLAACAAPDGEIIDSAKFGPGPAIPVARAAPAPSAVPYFGQALGAGLVAYGAAITPPPPVRLQTTCIRVGAFLNCN